MPISAFTKTAGSDRKRPLLTDLIKFRYKCRSFSHNDNKVKNANTTEYITALNGVAIYTKVPLNHKD